MLRTSNTGSCQVPWWVNPHSSTLGSVSTTANTLIRSLRQKSYWQLIYKCKTFSFSKPHCLLTNGHCLTTCSSNFQNQHITTQTWVWCQYSKNPQPEITTYSSSKAKAALFSHADHTDIYSEPANPWLTTTLSIQSHQANWMLPLKPQTAPDTTAEYVETFQPMARNYTNPTSHPPPAPFLWQPARRVYTVFSAECTWGCIEQEQHTAGV